MSLDFWSPGRVLDGRPTYYRTEDDAPACRSVLYTGNGSEPGPRSCRVNHWETGETLHGAWVGSNWSAWDDAMAARSLAEFGPRPDALCFEEGCTRPVVAGGQCGRCLNAEQARDDREDTEDAA